MWARTLCPLLSSTRNIAFGRASTIVPSISMTPSFLAIPSQSAVGRLFVRRSAHGNRPRAAHAGLHPCEERTRDRRSMLREGPPQHEIRGNGGSSLRREGLGWLVA